MPQHSACKTYVSKLCSKLWLLLQVRASTATWVATLPYVEFSTVVLQDNSIFLAFFESESGNKAAAAYALASAHRVSPLTLVHLTCPKPDQTTAFYVIQSSPPTTLRCIVQAFEAAHATGQGDMQSVLQATFTSLDEGFLADTHLPSMVRCAHHPA